MSYMAMHNRLRRVRGSARNLTCPCGQQAQEWAYSNHSASEETDREGRRYSRSLADYVAMCFRCHRLHDRSAITCCPKDHPYAGENLLMDNGKRKCRTCVYARNRKRSLTPEQRERKNALQRARRRERNATWFVGEQLAAHIATEVPA